METDAETVVDVLYDLNDLAEVDGMLQLLYGDCQPADLCYEDWIRPMKLTGGRICLRCEWEGNVWFSYRCGAGLLLCCSSGQPREEAKVVDPDQVKSDLAAPDVDVSPILRSDTPFAEADDG